MVVKKRMILTGNLKLEMSKLKINPLLTHWILSAVNGEIPKPERVTPLTLSIPDEIYLTFLRGGTPRGTPRRTLF